MSQNRQDVPNGRGRGRITSKPDNPPPQGRNRPASAPSAANSGRSHAVKTPLTRIASPLNVRSAYDAYTTQILANLEVVSKDVEREECQLCAHPSVLWAASGDCQDCPLICAVCALKSRVADQQDTCRFCARTLGRILIFAGRLTDDPSISTRIEDISPVFQVASPTEMMRDKKMFATSENLSLYLSSLLAPVCWAPSCGGSDVKAGRLPSHQFPKMSLLNAHLSKEHGAKYCPLCKALKSSNIQIEHIIYPSKDFNKTHCRAGDPANQVSRHPECKWCDKFFGDDEELIIHQNKEHETCTICRTGRSVAYYKGDVPITPGASIYSTDAIVQARQRQRGQGLSLGYLNPEDTKAMTVFKDISALFVHNAKTHFPCPAEECNLVVFDDYGRLRKHWDRIHVGKNLEKMAKAYFKELGLRDNSVHLFEKLFPKSPGKPKKKTIIESSSRRFGSDQTGGDDENPNSVIKSILDAVNEYFSLVLSEGSGMDYDEEFTWQTQDGLPNRIGMELLQQPENTIKHLCRLIEDLGSLHVPAPLLENVMKLVTLFNRMHGDIKGVQEWSDACRSAFHDQPSSYLALIQVYLEVCQDIIDHATYAVDLEHTSATQDFDADKKTKIEEFPSLIADAESDTVASQVQYYGANTPPRSSSDQPSGAVYRGKKEDQFPDLDIGNYVASNPVITQTNFFPNQQARSAVSSSKGKASLSSWSSRVARSNRNKRSPIVVHANKKNTTTTTTMGYSIPELDVQVDSEFELSVQGRDTSPSVSSTGAGMTNWAAASSKPKKTTVEKNWGVQHSGNFSIKGRPQKPKGAAISPQLQLHWKHNSSNFPDIDMLIEEEALTKRVVPAEGPKWQARTKMNVTPVCADCGVNLGGQPSMNQPLICPPCRMNRDLATKGQDKKKRNMMQLQHL